MARAVKNGKDRQTETRRAAQMMKRIMIHFRSQMDEKLRPQGVTTAQLHVLKVIRDGPGGSGAQVARACYMTPQSAQALLKSLADDGWITRAKDPVNERILIAQLTPSGVGLLETAERLARVIEKRLWAGVPDSGVEALNKTLMRCLANLEGVERTRNGYRGQKREAKTNAKTKYRGSSLRSE